MLCSNIYYFLRSVLTSVAFVTLVIVNSTNSFSVTKQHDVKPFIPHIMGMGNGFVAQAYGLHSLWRNPAGLAHEYMQHDGDTQEVTVLSTSLNAQPSFPGAFDFFGDLTVSNSANAIDNIIDRLTTTGLRVGQSIYGGYLSQSPIYSGSWGIAVSNTVNIFGRSYGSIFSTNMYLIDQLEIMVGYAYQFQVSNYKIRIGASLRPFFRTYNVLNGHASVEVLFSQDFYGLLDNTIGLHGWGVGADIGAQFEWNGLLVGLAARNIYTPVFYNSVNVLEYFTGNLGQAVGDTYLLPLSLDFGIGYKIAPPILKRILHATVYVELQDPFDNTNTHPLIGQDFLKHVHIGMDVAILPPFFNVQVGFNHGYPTFGIKTDLWFVDLSFVIYAREESEKINGLYSPGMGAEFAFRW